MLDHLKPTAAGLDMLAAWFLRLGAPAFADPLPQLFNQSLVSETVPQQRKKACVTSIPKAVLSSMIERHIVKSYIYPALQQPAPGLYYNSVKVKFIITLLQPNSCNVEYTVQTHSTEKVNAIKFHCRMKVCN